MINCNLLKAIRYLIKHIFEICDIKVESYKAENQHWLSQLNDTQREHMELRSRLTEQKAVYVKQLADKDGQIDQMRSMVNNLKVSPSKYSKLPSFFY